MGGSGDANCSVLGCSGLKVFSLPPTSRIYRMLHCTARRMCKSLNSPRKQEWRMETAPFARSRPLQPRCCRRGNLGARLPRHSVWMLIVTPNPAVSCFRLDAAEQDRRHIISRILLTQEPTLPAIPESILHLVSVFDP
jgi:hypothetical protein